MDTRKIHITRLRDSLVNKIIKYFSFIFYNNSEKLK